MEDKNRYLSLQAEIREKNKEGARLYWSSFLTDEEISGLIERNDLNEIGQGTDCVVVSHSPVPEQSEKSGNVLKNPKVIDTVVALDYAVIRSPKEAKKLFYTHRIMSTLFPHNFPRFQMTWGRDEKRQDSSGSVRKRVVVLEKGGSPRSRESLDSTATHPFRNVMKEAQELKIPLNIDSYVENFGMGEDGGVYYLDKLYVYDDDDWPLKRMLEYMRKNNYSDLAVKIVESSVKRLGELISAG
jgi:hypothetical protein